MFRKLARATFIPLILSISLIFNMTSFSKSIEAPDLGEVMYTTELTDSGKVKKKEYSKGWVTTSVNVRKFPNIYSDILETYSFNTMVMCTDYNEEWVEIKYGDNVAYMYKEYISDEKCKYEDFKAPSNSGFKSYMPYRAITAVDTPQYALQRNEAYTGKYGIRQVNGRYCVAVGSYFTSKIGTLFDLVLENGTVIPCILADQKADKDTDSQNIVTRHNGCLSEFVVDTAYLPRKVKLNGDISYCNDSWNSPVEIIRVYR